MKLLIYLLLILLFADTEAKIDAIKIQANLIINHVLNFIYRASIAVLIAFLAFEGIKAIPALITAGGLFGAYFMIRLNLLRDRPWDYISRDPKGSKIDYAYWRFSKRFGGILLVITYVLIAILGVIWYAR